MASDRRWAELINEIPNASTETRDDWSRLVIRLSFYGSTSWIFPILERGADPRFKDENGDTALSECLSGALRRNPTFLTFAALLEAKADPNEITRGGSRILQLAIMEDLPEYAALLLLHGADPRLPSPDPDRPDAFLIARTHGRGWAAHMLDRWRVEFPEKASERLPDPWA